MEGNSLMTKVWCVRANAGEFTEHFLRDGYAAIDWRAVAQDLSGITTREALYPIVKAAYPEAKSTIVIGNYVGQIARFLLDIQPGDYVITPAADTDWLHYGVIADGASYYFVAGDDGCPCRHRRRVTWSTQRVKRSELSVPFQNAIRSLLTVFAVSRQEEFLSAIGRGDLNPKVSVSEYDSYKVVLEQVLELDATEFEILVGYLLTALGFEGSEVTGKTGDGGVDATGELNVANLAKVKVFVQAKRYKLGSKVSANVVKHLRTAIPFGGQGAFITTADYQSAAADVALEPGFPRIGLINGRQLVDLLIEHWSDIPEDFRERLGLKPGLVRA
jgi:hypothetical protein